MCLGMNPDQLTKGQRCASTSNRNFEGRQGHGGRTHLVSPATAAASAIKGHFVDITKMNEKRGKLFIQRQWSRWRVEGDEAKATYTYWELQYPL